MSDFRAKDADRDRYVEIIEAAYVDGQLGAEDRDLRVTRALSAVTLDELETLDAGPPGTPAPVSSPQVAAPARARRGWPARSSGGILVAVLGVGGPPWPRPPARHGRPPPGPPMPNGGAAAPDAPPGQSAAPDVEPFVMTAPQVRRFLDSHEEEFGTLDTFEAGFYPTRVGVQVPVRGSRARMERWSYDGAWTQDTEARRVVGAEGVIDLAQLDVGRLFANIRQAERTLEVQRGRLTHVLVNTWTDGAPTVNIYIGNDYNETGYLKTTLAGDVVRAFPYDG